MKLGTTTLSVTTAGRPRQKYAASGGGGGGGGPVVWNNISTATAVRNSRLAFPSNYGPNGFYFKPDGTKLFISYSSSANYYIDEYTLSTPWDISTYSKNHTFTPPSPYVRVMDIFIKPDGTRLFYSDWQTDRVVEFTMTTAWDLSSMSASPIQFFDIPSETYLRGLWFTQDGIKMFVHGFSTDKIRSFDLSTPWDITSSTAVGTSSIMGTVPLSLFFKEDGTRAYSTENTGDTIKQWNLSTPYDITGISTSNYDDIINYGSIDNQPSGIYISADGSRLYLGGGQHDKLYQLSL